MSVTPPPVVTPQCVQFSTFAPPPLDGSLLLPEVYDWHLERSPEHVLYKYEGPEGSVGEIKWKDAALAAHRAAHLLRSHADADKGAKLAFLALADSVTFGAAIVGAMKVGFAPLIISPRNSPDVITGLLQKGEITHVIHTTDPGMTRLAGASTRDTNIQLVPMPTYTDLYNDSPVSAPVAAKPNLFAPAARIHSSGSTSVPKLLTISHATLYLMGTMGWAHDRDVGSATMNFALLPMFHIMGLASLSFAAYNGLAIGVFPPGQPFKPPTAEGFIRSVMATKSTIAMSMPSILEPISNSPADIEKLVHLDSVLYGGAAIKPSVAEKLVQAGIKLMSGYGMSECGTITRIPAVSHGWEWVHLEHRAKPHFRDLGDGTSELIFISHGGHPVDTVNCEIDGQPALATKDIVIPHPTDTHAFKIVGRLDDVLILSTGEKTNAAPLEAILCSDRLIQRALIFGRDRPRNGVFIEPHADHTFDPLDRQKLAEFRDAIWSAVVKMNDFAPSHSRLIKEMIFVTPPNKPLVINPTKGTIVRSLAIAAYEQEIADAYDAFDRAVDANIQTPSNWSPPHTLAFVREVVRTSMPEVPTDESDFFIYGGDSLKAARIHNIIVQALRTSGVASSSLPADLPYKYPTITSLADFVSTTGLNGNAELDVKTRKVAEVEAILSKYTQLFSQHTPSTKPPEDKGLVFLVTGTTGGLGTNLLAQLLGSPEVHKVFALNRRGSGVSLLERHKIGFLDRGVDPSVLNQEKLVILEGDTSRADLGIPPSTYEDVRTSVTHIIHNAWPVNFNYAIQTFESAVIGVRNLVDLALKSARLDPPRFMFISSITVSRNIASSERFAPEEPVLDPGLVVGQGYAESKWIAERMLQIASEKTALISVSVRVGQLAGGSNGSWTATDWVPVIVRSAAKLRCLPSASIAVSWVRLDEAAASLLEMRDANGVLHLVHPHPVPWDTVFATFSQELDVPLVPFEEWLTRLRMFAEAHPGKGNDVPAVRLLEYFNSLQFSAEALVTDKTQGISSKLRGMRSLTGADALGWIAYWRKAGVVA